MVKEYNKPSSGIVKDKRQNTAVFCRGMVNRTQSMFVYTGLPETVPQRVLERYLLTNGHCVIAEVNGELYPLDGTFSGLEDAYHERTLYTVTNTALNLAKQFELGKDCVLCRNDSECLGLSPIFEKYGELLAENDLTIYTTLVLSRSMVSISAADDKTRQSANEYLRKIENGDLMCIAENAFFDGVKIHGSFGGSAGLLQQFIELEQYLKASCFNEIGINANYNMKRESITANEFALNDDFLLPLVDDMYKRRTEFIDEINNKYGLNVSIDYSSSWKTTQAENTKELNAALDGENNESEAVKKIQVNEAGNNHENPETDAKSPDEPSIGNEENEQ